MGYYPTNLNTFRKFGKNSRRLRGNTLVDSDFAWEAALISRLFLEHPRSVNETYLEHMAFAGWFATMLFMAGGAAVHALMPCCFDKTASSIIAELYERTHTRRGKG